MSYIKTEWDNGDIITAEKLNNVESGIEGINVSYEKTTWETGDKITAVKLNNIENGIEEAGSSDSDPFIILQTISVPAQSITTAWDSEYEMYRGSAEIASASADALAEYSYNDYLTYKKYLMAGDEVGDFYGVALDTTGLPESVLALSLYLDDDKWAVLIETESAATITLNPQTVIAYRATEIVADYFKNLAVVTSEDL